MKKLVTVCLSVALALSTITISPWAAAETRDVRIFTDKVDNVYLGVGESKEMINNINFGDIAPDFWAGESIARGGALNVIKGFDKDFSSNAIVSNQEAIAYAIRAIGLEELAQQRALTLRNQMPVDSPARELWSIGYLSLAAERGIITRDDFNDAINPSQNNLRFMREAPAIRENVADWFVKALKVKDPAIFNFGQTQQNIYEYSDWNSIAPEKIASVESALKAGIFRGSEGRFNPKGSLTGAEIAQTIKNMDNSYYMANGMKKKTATVGGQKDSQFTTNNAGSLTRDVYVRTSEGEVDIFRYNFFSSSFPKDTILDAVVYKEGRIEGLASLEEGDQIEYIINSTNQLLYVQVITAVNPELNVSIGVLKSIDPVVGSVTINDAGGKAYTYMLASGIYGQNPVKNKKDTPEYYLVINGIKRNSKNIPIGSHIELNLRNKVVENITFLGEMSLIDEQRGIVIENNADLGYLTYVDNFGNEITKNYFDDDIKVEKQQYYDNDDEIGYIDETFPNFKYDPRDTFIDEVEAGDIVFLRFDPEDPERIINVSASTNYRMKYGKILEFNIKDGLSSLLVEYESKETAWFDVANEIFLSRDGYAIDIADIKVGDWTKVLVNQAIIAPGEIMESVKEMTIEGDEHYISSIVRGRLSQINSTQNKIVIEDAQTLGTSNWENHKTVATYSIAGKDIEYYQDGKRISLDYALKFLKRNKADVYIAFENSYSGEKVKKVTFRSGRDEILKPDSVINADGNGSFSILSNNGEISTDDGTIVRRHGRLVSGRDIQIPDHAIVTLNGDNKAAIVDIVDSPGIADISVLTGRIKKIDDGKSFTFSAMASLNGTEWSYTPIERIFTFDYDTMFFNEDGLMSNKAFVAYGEDSLFETVCNVVVEGGYAEKVIVDVPYSNKSVRGVIYNIETATDETTILIKDATYYNEKTGKWLPVSRTNATATITVLEANVVVKNNVSTTLKYLAEGDQIRVMVDNLPEKINGPIEVEGQIILVEK